MPRQETGVKQVDTVEVIGMYRDQRSKLLSGWRLGMIRARRIAAYAYGIDFSTFAALFLLCFIPIEVRSAAAQGPTTSRIEHADKEPQNWLSFYGNYRGWSYRELNQITRENVKSIVPVWAFP